MKSYIALLITFLCHLQSISNVGFHANFWRSEATFITIDTISQVKEGAYIIQDNRHIHYQLTTRKETQHKIIHIINQDGLDNVNKVVIYVPKSASILEIKARSISPDGKVTELNRDNIKDITNYDENADLKIFAIEGAQIGGQIEYYYSIQTPLYDSGIEAFDRNYFTQKAYFLIQGYEGTLIDAKAFNQQPDTSRKEDNYYWFSYKNVPPVKDEAYSTPDANTAFVEHKIVAVQYSNETIFSKYKYIHRIRQSQLFNFNAPEKRKLGKHFKQLDIKSIESLADLVKVHNYLKKNFFFEDSYDQAYSDINNVLKSRVGNDLGLTKVYCLFLSELDLNYQVLITCNKYSFKLDPDYCSRYFLTEYLIYVPLFNIYIYPASPIAQIGLTPQWIEGNTALVIGKNDTKPDFRLVFASDYSTDIDHQDMKVILNTEEGTSDIELYGYGTGQIAYDFNSDHYFAESDEERAKVFLNYFEWQFPDCEIYDMKKINPEDWGNIDACNDYACKREFSAKIKSPSLFSVVGDKIILNVGTLIGPQSELYSEDARQQPITTAHNKSYHFEITIQIPEGYQYSGNQGVEIENYHSSLNGSTDYAGFKSTIQIIENRIVIIVDEFYSTVNLSVNQYPGYRKVINSSADFNKSVITLEKI